MADSIVENKICGHCQQSKPVFEFGKNKSTKDGRSSYCKSCKASSDKSYQKTEKGKATKDAAHRRHRASGKRGMYLKRYYRDVLAGSAEMRARSTINNHVSRGAMSRARELACDNCQKPAESYHHHKGYAPEHHLDVIPLCRDCHAKADNP